MIRFKKNSLLLLVVLFFVSALSYSFEVFADYRINGNRIYLDKYVKNSNDRFEVKYVSGSTYEITDSGNFTIRDGGGRRLNIVLKSGVIDGTYSEYYANGNLFISGKYVDGQKEGEWKTYSEAGKVWKKYQYKNDLLNGKFISYYTNTGREESVANYRDDILDGNWSEYYSNGGLKISGMYSDGKRNGIFTEWYESGVKKSEINYVDDEINGKMKVYYENGRVFYEANIDGRSAEIKGYNTNGGTSFNGKVNDFKRKTGTWTFYSGIGTPIIKNY